MLQTTKHNTEAHSMTHTTQYNTERFVFAFDGLIKQPVSRLAGRTGGPLAFDGGGAFLRHYPCCPSEGCALSPPSGGSAVNLEQCSDLVLLLLFLTQ